MISEARQAIIVSKVSHYGKTKLKVEAFAGKKFYPFDNSIGRDENFSNAANKFAAFYHWDTKFYYIGANSPNKIEEYIFVGVPRENKKEIRRINVVGQRWFDKVNGNTYCAAKVYINSKLVIVTDWTNGYSDFYEQLANEQLNKKGLLDTKQDSKSISLMSLYRYCEENNIQYSTHVNDGLKRELVAFSKCEVE